MNNGNQISANSAFTESGGQIGQSALDLLKASFSAAAPANAHAADGSSAQHPGAVMYMLDRIGCGFLAFAAGRKVVEANATARAILMVDADARNADDPGVLDELSRAFNRLVGLSSAARSLGSLTSVIVSGKYHAPLVLSHAEPLMPAGKSIAMLVDLDSHLRPNPALLQRMFGLTPAEIRLALELAQGGILADIAQRRRLSRTTVRSQLASVFSKTQTTRQAELVQLLNRIAILP